MTVKNAILGLLSQRPRHGYELHAAFEALVGGKQNWEVKPAQVYTTLNRLAQGGFIAEDALAQEGGPEKLIYAITAQGEGELQAWLSTPTPTQHQRDEFFLKLMITLATNVVDPYRLIYTQRTNLYRELHAATAQRNAANPRAELAQILLMDQVIMHLEADLRWLEMVEARLDELKDQPVPVPEPRPRGRPPRGDDKVKG
jgi:DNA-binding PadR family transcriptional regulator